MYFILSSPFPMSSQISSQLHCLSLAEKQKESKTKKSGVLATPEPGACPGVRLIVPLSLHWRILIFPSLSSYQFSNSFLAGGRTDRPLSHFIGGIWSGLNLCSCNACCYSLCVLSALGLLCLENAISLKSSTTSGSYSLSAFFSLSLEGRSVMKAYIQGRAPPSSSFTPLIVQLWVSKPS